MGGTTLLRSAGSDEDGGNQANIAASGSEQSNTAMFAPPICRRRWAEQRFSVPPDPTKTAATKRTSPRAAASNQTLRSSRN